MWILLGLGIVSIIVATLGRSRQRARGRDLGGVSNLWLAEHRHSEVQDPRR